jgi:hypothetical protein
MSIGRLIIAPTDPWLGLSPQSLVSHLQQMGLCGEPLPDRPEHYAAGEDFLRWISFAGCSPFMRFEPESATDQAFCHLHIHRVDGQPLFVSGANSKPPTCPACRKALRDWRTLMRAWQQTSVPPHCPACDAAIAVDRLNWRRHAGLARTLVEIFNVFPGEAVPVDGLFAELKRLDGHAWHYFFAG